MLNYLSPTLNLTVCELTIILVKYFLEVNAQGLNLN